MPITPESATPFVHDGGPVGVLVIHGFTGTPDSVREWAQRVAAAGHSVRVPLLPGHGTTWEDMNRTTWQDWYGTVETEFLALSKACETVFVFGLSMGGCLALRLAELHGARIAGLSLVNPSVLTKDPRRHVLPLIRRATPSFPAIGGDIKAPGVTEPAYDRLPLHALASLQQMWGVVRADLNRVEAPLLLFTSVEDHVVENESSYVVLGSVSSRYRAHRVLPNSYHVATMDNDKETIFSESLEFVARFSAEDGA